MIELDASYGEGGGQLLRIAVALAARAGFDPRAAVTLWDKMARQGASPPQFLGAEPTR